MGPVAEMRVEVILRQVLGLESGTAESFETIHSALKRSEINESTY